MVDIGKTEFVKNIDKYFNGCNCENCNCIKYCPKCKSELKKAESRNIFNCEICKTQFVIKKTKNLNM
jgi:primosomal protein N'